MLGLKTACNHCLAHKHLSKSTKLVQIRQLKKLMSVLNSHRKLRPMKKIGGICIIKDPENRPGPSLFCEGPEPISCSLCWPHTGDGSELLWPSECKKMTQIRRISRLGASLVYRVSPRIAWATQRNSVLKNKNKSTNPGLNQTKPNTTYKQAPSWTLGANTVEGENQLLKLLSAHRM